MRLPEEVLRAAEGDRAHLLACIRAVRWSILCARFLRLLYGGAEVASVSVSSPGSHSSAGGQEAGSRFHPKVISLLLSCNKSNPRSASGLWT